MNESSSQILSNPWQVAFAAYLAVGFIVVGAVWIRAWRQPPADRFVWKRDSPGRNLVFALLVAGRFHPVDFLIEVILWPLWLLLVWAYSEDDDQTI